MNNVDPYSIATNGLLTSNTNNYFVTDGLGYYTIQISEEIIEIDVPTVRNGNWVGRLPKRGRKQSEKILVKEITVTINLDSHKEYFKSKIQLTDVNLTVTNAIINGDEITLTIHNPTLNIDETRIVKLNVVL
jgi:DnaJ-class molecular chaperone